MEVRYHSEAKEDLKEINQQARDRIKQKVKQLEEDPTGHEDTKLVQIKGRDIYRLEIKEKRRGSIDHRAIYDIEDGKIRIYSVFYREPGYPREEIASRL